MSGDALLCDLFLFFVRVVRQTCLPFASTGLEYGVTTSSVLVNDFELSLKITDPKTIAIIYHVFYLENLLLP